MSNKEKKAVNPIGFLKQVKSETKKITWPSKQEVVQTSVMVSILIAFFVVFFFAVDQVWGKLIKFILGIGE